MSRLWTRRRADASRGKSRGAGLLAAALAVSALTFTGCGVPLPNADVLVTAEGTQIRLDHIAKILDDDTLTEEQKRSGLTDLGITDQDLIQFLLDSEVL